MSLEIFTPKPKLKESLSSDGSRVDPKRFREGYEAIFGRSDSEVPAAQDIKQLAEESAAAAESYITRDGQVLDCRGLSQQGLQFLQRFRRFANGAYHIAERSGAKERSRVQRVLREHRGDVNIIW